MFPRSLESANAAKMKKDQITTDRKKTKSKQKKLQYLEVGEDPTIDCT